jgi:hypothetical protein
LALDAKEDVADLQRKLAAVETAKIEIEARLNIAKHALERLTSWTVLSTRYFQRERSAETSY